MEQHNSNSENRITLKPSAKFQKFLNAGNQDFGLFGGHILQNFLQTSPFQRINGPGAGGYPRHHAILTESYAVAKGPRSATVNYTYRHSSTSYGKVPKTKQYFPAAGLQALHLRQAAPKYGGPRATPPGHQIDGLNASTEPKRLWLNHPLSPTLTPRSANMEGPTHSE